MHEVDFVSTVVVVRVGAHNFWLGWGGGPMREICSVIPDMGYREWGGGGGGK